MTRFLPAVVVSAVFILWAPFIGEIRNWLQRTFPGHFVAIVAGAVAVAVIGALVSAVTRIRVNRMRRYGALLVSVGLFAVWILELGTGNAEVDAVEMVHFVEYGLVALLFYRAVRPRADPSIFVLTLLFGVLVGTLEEWLQWFVPTRVGEARDVFLNLYAVTSGFIFSVGLEPPAGFSWRLRPGAARSVLRFAAAVVLVFGAFFHCAHLGYEIQDDEIGRFRSYFTAAQLAALSAARAEEWRLNPPQRLQLLGREDYYLTEGGWHAQARNDAYTAREFSVAWNENRILEKYFDPFLDLRSFSSHERHRWAPAQRAEVEAVIGTARPEAYVSQAGLTRVYVRPRKIEFWSGIAVLAGLLLGLSARRRRGSTV